MVVLVVVTLVVSCGGAGCGNVGGIMWRWWW